MYVVFDMMYVVCGIDGVGVVGGAWCRPSSVGGDVVVGVVVGCCIVSVITTIHSIVFVPVTTGVCGLCGHAAHMTLQYSTIFKDSEFLDFDAKPSELQWFLLVTGGGVRLHPTPPHQRGVRFLRTCSQHGVIILDKFRRFRVPWFLCLPNDRIDIFVCS